jgi:hypothetical protein
MSETSSTLKATAGWGFLATLVIGTVAIIWPDVAARIPPGFEAALAVGIGLVAGKMQKENVLEAQFKAKYGIE